MWDPTEDKEEDDYVDNGMEFNSELLDKDFDEVAFDPQDIDDSDDDAADFVDY